MVRICPGQDVLIANNPSAGLPCSSVPSGSRITGVIPKNGNVAEPGFNSVAAGNGVTTAVTATDTVTISANPAMTPYITSTGKALVLGF